MSEVFTAGQTAFLEDGQAVEVVSKAGNQYVVLPIYESEDDEPYTGSQFIVGALYSEPPVGKRHEEIVRLDDSIAAKRAELNEITAGLYESRRSIKQIEVELSKHKALEYIHDFVAGKMTHFVTYSSGTYKVLAAADALKDNDDRWSRETKLLTLHGRSNGDLMWNIHRYSDGSGGSYTEAMPFMSEDAAIAWAVEQIAAKLADPKLDGYRRGYVIISAKEFGVAIPQQVLDAERDALIKSYTQRREHALKSLAEADALLAGVAQ